MSRREFGPEMELSFDAFKEQIDLLLKQINLQRQCIKSIGSFERFLQDHFSPPPPPSADSQIERSTSPQPDPLDKIRNRFESFRRSFRQLQKRNRRLEKRRGPIDDLYGYLFHSIKPVPVPDNEKENQAAARLVAENRLSEAPNEKSDDLDPKNDCQKAPNKKKAAKKKSPKPTKSVPKKKAVAVKKAAASKKQPARGTANSITKTNAKTATTNGKKRGPIQKVYKMMKCKHPDCQYECRFMSQMNQHVQRIHSKGQPHICLVCKKVFTNVYNLRYHALIHTGQRFHCPYEGCTAAYAWYRTLKKHITLHNNTAPEHHCDWPGCEYTTHRMELMRKHRTRHTGERNFACNWPACEKTFKTKSGLFDHIAIHKNERKYACTWAGCSYRCNLSGNLKKHIAIHEKKLMNATTIVISSSNKKIPSTGAASA